MPKAVTVTNTKNNLAMLLMNVITNRWRYAGKIMKSYGRNLRATILLIISDREIFENFEVLS